MATASSQQFNWVKFRKSVFSLTTGRGIASIIIFTILWEICSRLGVPIIGNVPPPSAVLAALGKQLVSPAYWMSWLDSFVRILTGFAIAQVLGIPLGLLLGVNRTARELIYPIFEIMRPIPPLAWVPIAVIFWPTTELSMMFVTFLGAFFTVVLNIVGGASSIDLRYIRAAHSLGSSRSDIFWRVMLPATLPSIVVGMTVGMGITWAVVVAAEMIASRSGLGFLTWRAYVAGEYPLIIIGMMSIGIAGYVSSALIRMIGSRLTPWLRTF
ncbi:ABC transporter permease [Fundidesulfovibrio agrisoli]|uniref:ABC transporter permease n=1 Tax=Fundidesulfovibrio agrisoli TaxID=2922717 RepID=UPI001FAB6781|nr:ABC transporter permease [Fundidesulfovibrio agrisoli]